MDSQIRVVLQGVYWRMSCGSCDFAVCFDDRSAAIQEARAHLGSHRQERVSELVVLVDDGGVDDDACCTQHDPGLFLLGPLPDFHGSPPAWKPEPVWSRSRTQH